MCLLRLLLVLRGWHVETMADQGNVTPRTRPSDNAAGVSPIPPDPHRRRITVEGLLDSDMPDEGPAPGTPSVLALSAVSDCEVVAVCS